MRPLDEACNLTCVKESHKYQRGKLHRKTARLFRLCGCYEVSNKTRLEIAAAQKMQTPGIPDCMDHLEPSIECPKPTESNHVEAAREVLFFQENLRLRFLIDHELQMRKRKTCNPRTPSPQSWEASPILRSASACQIPREKVHFQIGLNGNHH